MLGKGHPTLKENAKELRKNGAVLFYATDSNLLFLREGETWKALGHVAFLEEPTWNQPSIWARLKGIPT